MKVGLIGLGKMGAQIAQKLTEENFTVAGYDPFSKLDLPEKFNQLQTVAELANQVDIIWIMVPAGKVVDEVLEELTPHLKANTILIDGGNSKFTDTVHRAEKLEQQNVYLLDCGTSGGIRADEGFSLMIGGNKDAFEKAEPIFKALAAPQGYGHVGPSGAGHYVKMIHNGIEYTLLEGYAEGFDLLRNGQYKNLDLAQISNIWDHGAVIRSWILQLTHEILEKDQSLANVSGEVAESGMGRWTEEEANKQNIPMPALEAALKVRSESRRTGGNYATKLIAMLRNAFGGHSVKKSKD